jgi:hypothetical protein
MKNERPSIALTNADSRLRGLKAIDPALNLGNNCTLAAFNLLTEQLRDKLNQHNDLIAALESSKKDLKALENQVNQMSSKMLKGVGFVYGQDSDEYELAGGVTTSERVRKSRATRLKTVTDNQSSPGDTAA